MFRNIVGNHTCWSLGRDRRLGSAWPSRFGGRCAACLANPSKTALPNRRLTHARLCRQCSGCQAVRTGWCCGLVWLSLAPFQLPSFCRQSPRPRGYPCLGYDVVSLRRTARGWAHQPWRGRSGAIRDPVSEKERNSLELVGVQPSKVPRSKIQGLASKVQVVVEVVSAPWTVRTVAYCAVLQTRVLLGIEWRPRPSSSNGLHPSTFARFSAHMGLHRLHRLHRLAVAFLSLQQRPSSQSACPASLASPPARPLIQASRFDDPISDRPCLALAKPISLWVWALVWPSNRRVVSVLALPGLGGGRPLLGPFTAPHPPSPRPLQRLLMHMMSVKSCLLVAVPTFSMWPCSG